MARRWLSVRLEMLGICIVFGAALFVAVLLPRNAGLAGLALTSALNLTGRPLPLLTTSPAEACMQCTAPSVCVISVSLLTDTWMYAVQSPQCCVVSIDHVITGPCAYAAATHPSFVTRQNGKRRKMSVHLGKGMYSILFT